jgi:hypothetical protein
MNASRRRSNKKPAINGNISLAWGQNERGEIGTMDHQGGRGGKGSKGGKGREGSVWVQ